MYITHMATCFIFKFITLYIYIYINMKLFLGCSGKSIELLTNYFPIVSITDIFPYLYQYSVNFNPDELLISTKSELLAQHTERLGLYLFDGKFLFSITQYDLNVSY
jgi:hypothetical protein